MELRHLRYFVGVAEELHFARAAARLGISQPPLSQQIAALEQELGVRLFDRTSRSVCLTAAGTAFLSEARATLAQADRAIHVAHRAARGEGGQLNLGFNASAPFVPQIAKAIFDYRQAYPDVKLALTELAGCMQPNALSEHALDVCFVRSFRRPDVDASVAATPILEERMMVAMRPDHRFANRPDLGLRDLEGEPLILYSREDGATFTQELYAMLRGVGVEPNLAYTVREVSTLFGLAAAGIGVTVVAESLCALQSSKLVYVPLSDPESRTGMWLLHRRDNASLTCRAFLDVVAASAPA
ncbi:LysR substrate-binding domain-containing protein [Sphingomonas glacialis]|uniref:LysR family transcriptional regulator n=1 Tax=Sphingomonas glacialis TaxID=658225 RepID=A0A502FHV4_9SPHN|nr:LysR substrate-binding domain-containing protein [Sphingomonas glacialis]TPG49067.1 LysR family transcriptional regulator [Sphingomonas glacialis]